MRWKRDASLRAETARRGKGPLICPFSPFPVAIRNGQQYVGTGRPRRGPRPRAARRLGQPPLSRRPQQHVHPIGKLRRSHTASISSSFGSGGRSVGRDGAGRALQRHLRPTRADFRARDRPLRQFLENCPNVGFSHRGSCVRPPKRHIHLRIFIYSWRNIPCPSTFAIRTSPPWPRSCKILQAAGPKPRPCALRFNRRLSAPMRSAPLPSATRTSSKWPTRWAPRAPSSNSKAFFDQMWGDI